MLFHLTLITLSSWTDGFAVVALRDFTQPQHQKMKISFVAEPTWPAALVSPFVRRKKKKDFSTV